MLFNANAVGTLQQLTCILTEVYSGCWLFRVSYRLFSSQLLSLSRRHSNEFRVFVQREE